MLRTLWVETMKGKSVHRILTNLRAAQATVSGRGLDLGAKDGRSSHYRFLAVEPGTQITYTDLYPKAPNVLPIDLERYIPVPDDSQDFLLLMHVLEHLFDYRTCLRECFRVLRPGGRLIGAVPFLHRIHPDPSDYFRYTGEALHRMLNEAGFAQVTVEGLGFGPMTGGVSQFGRLLKFKPLVFATLAAAIGLDAVLKRLFPSHPNVRAANFPLVYYFEAQK